VSDYKKYSVFVLGYPKTYKLSKAEQVRNPQRQEKAPIVRVVYTSKSVDDYLAEKRDEAGKGKKPWLRSDYPVRKRTEMGALKLRDKLIVDLHARGWTVLNGEDEEKYRVYCIEIDESQRPTTKQNEGFEPDMNKPVFYVGQSSKAPEERLAQHVSCVKASRYVTDHVVALRMDVVRDFSVDGFMALRDARLAEHNLAAHLRRRGFGVRGGH
jgi:hypothetical protein